MQYDSGISATTVMVDVDQLEEELKELRRRKGEAVGDDDDRPSGGDPGGTGIPPAEPYLGPVHRPSWGGALLPPPPPAGDDRERFRPFRCGR